MKPFYQDNHITIYQGDCKEILPQLEADYFDLVITSPPYNCRMPYLSSDDQMPWPEYYRLMTFVIGQCYRILTKGGTIAINVPTVIRWQAEHKYADTWTGYDGSYQTHRKGQKVIGKGRIEPLAFRLYSIMENFDSHMREPIIWVKGNDGFAITTRYAMGADSDPYMRPAHEMILLGSKGQWFHRGGTGRRGGDAVPFLDETKDVWFIVPTSNDKHPAVFPKELPSRLIRLFVHANNSIIIDPFMGIGQTLLAAKELNRKAIGIEIEEKYCEIAANRCRQMVVKL